MSEPKEINERRQQLDNEAMAGITQAWCMINKAAKLFIDSKVKNGFTENQAMEMAHAALVHEMANFMAYGYAHKYIPDLQLAVNNTAVRLAESVIEILEGHKPKDKGIITEAN